MTRDQELKLLMKIIGQDDFWRIERLGPETFALMDDGEFFIAMTFRTYEEAAEFCISERLTGISHQVDW